MAKAIIEKGSELGVTTPATTTINTMAHRRNEESCLGVSTPANSSDTSNTGNSKVRPNTVISNTMRLRYLVGSRIWVRLGPPILSSQPNAWGNVRNATSDPRANKAIEATMKGIAYFFSLGFNPGVMNRQSSQRSTGEARNSPP